MEQQIKEFFEAHPEIQSVDMEEASNDQRLETTARIYPLLKGMIPNTTHCSKGCFDICWFQGFHPNTPCFGPVFPVARVVDPCAALYGYSIHSCTAHQFLAKPHPADDHCGYMDVLGLDSVQ